MELSDLDPADLSWTDSFCCDEAIGLEETPVLGGITRRGGLVQGSPASPEEELAPGVQARVLSIAAGFKGKPPFRKRLWVKLLVLPEGQDVPQVASAAQVACLEG